MASGWVRTLRRPRTAEGGEPVRRPRRATTATVTLRRGRFEGVVDFGHRPAKNHDSCCRTAGRPASVALFVATHSSEIHSRWPLLWARPVEIDGETAERPPARSPSRVDAKTARLTLGHLDGKVISIRLRGKLLMQSNSDGRFRLGAQRRRPINRGGPSYRTCALPVGHRRERRHARPLGRRSRDRRDDSSGDEWTARR